MMEAVRTSETSVDNHFTRQYIPEDNSEQHATWRIFISSFGIICCSREEEAARQEEAARLRLQEEERQCEEERAKQEAQR